MNVEFYTQIIKSNANTNCRNSNRDLVWKNWECRYDWVEFGNDFTNKNPYKAFWIIQMLAENLPKLLISFIAII